MPEMQIYAGAVDKGLEGVVACTTSVSSIQGATLSYRGYAIEDLAAHATFEEVIFLLWNSRLPRKSELQEFCQSLQSQMKFPVGFLEALKALPTEVHPMAWLRTAVSLLAHFDPDANDSSTEAFHRKSLRLAAQMGPLVCAFEALRKKKPFVEPLAGKSISWNFMRSLLGRDPDPEIVKVFDTCLILHADHELNCSAFATRVTASSLSDLHSAIVSAIGALKG
ncbi:MAG: citrate/2-methylcitrate synthase, partial [Bdellovibrio sp.]